MNRSADIVQHFHGLRALVIGEAMLDTYLEGSATRLCREGPVPVVLKTGEHRFPGGAANTAMNLRALGADVTFLSVVGADQAGAALRTALQAGGVSGAWLVEDASVSTHHKLRILANGQYIVRFDEDAQVPSTASQQALLKALEHLYSGIDLVVISDYGYGVLAGELIERLRALRSARYVPLLVDSKYLHRYNHSRATVITPNQGEAESLVQRYDAQGDVNASKGVDHAAMRVLGQRLLSLIDAENVAITIAKDGVFLANRQGLAKHLPAYPVFHPNDIGAGDSFAAALALSLAAGASIEDAGSIAIDASSIAVTKRWTAIVTHQELLQRASLRDATAQIHTFASTDDRRNTGDFDYKKNGGATIDALVAKLEQERQRGRTIVFTNGIFDILHAGHVQLLRQAKTLGDILVVGVNSDRSAQHSKGRHRPINSERDRAALVDALDVVDYVVLFDEAIPLELLRKLRPQLFVKGGDYIDEALPEAEVVQQYGGRVIILPLAGASARSDVIGRIASLISSEQ